MEQALGQEKVIELVTMLKELSSSIENANFSTGQLAATAEEIAANASSAAESASNSSELVKEGRRAVRDVIERINVAFHNFDELANNIRNFQQNSQKILKISETIKGIASQSSLLSLNARIEAARAGEQGRGFSVVASQMNKLAENTVQATKEITESLVQTQNNIKELVGSIDAVNNLANEVVNMAEAMGFALDVSVSEVEATAEKIINISSANQEISATTAELAESMSNITTINKKLKSIGESKN